LFNPMFVFVVRRQPSVLGLTTRIDRFRGATR
jgi:hypothetical protein